MVNTSIASSLGSTLAAIDVNESQKASEEL